MGPLALIIFRKASLDLPAVSPIIRGQVFDEDEVEFIVGGTATPVPRDRCVPVRTMLEVIEYYLKHEELPNWLEWSAEL
jgi:hypothetical protein